MINLLFALALMASPEAKPEIRPATNAVCPVQGLKVTEKSKTVVVRGQEYRICCPGDCDTRLAKDPDKYLEKDGTPKNATHEDMKMPAGHDMGHMH